MTHKSGFRANKREESDEVVVNRPNINTLQCSLNETNVTRGSRLWTGSLVETQWCKAWPQTKLLPVYVRSVKDLIRKRNSDANLLTTGRRKLNGTTTWQSPNWKPRIATVDSCFDLVKSRQHGVASNKVISWSTDHPYPLNADGDGFRWNWNPNFRRLANVICKTHDKGQQEKSRISYRCRSKEYAERQKLSRRKIRANDDDIIFWILPVVLCNAFYMWH